MMHTKDVGQLIVGTIGYSCGKATNSYDMISLAEKRQVVYTIGWNVSLQAQEDHLRSGRSRKR
jgi:hypothetical protein